MGDSREEYFLIAALDYLQDKDLRSFSLAEVKEHCEGYYTEAVSIRYGMQPLRNALQALSSVGAVDELPDEYAGLHFVKNANALTAAENLLRGRSKYETYLRLGADGWDWLGRAFVGIERAGQDTPASAMPNADDIWEPLPVERTSALEAIQGAEAALDGIRADNGFAAQFPLERDSLVTHADATIASVKDGVATKGQVKENLVKAGKWLAEKFGGTAIGSLGGELVKWGLRLLGLL